MLALRDEKTATAARCDELIKSFPPALVISAQEANGQTLAEASDDQGLATVKLESVSAKYAFSMPTGQFNLVCPDKQTHIDGDATDYFNWCQKKKRQPAVEKLEGDHFEAVSDEGQVILAVTVVPQGRRPMKVSINIEANDDAERNVSLPLNELSCYTTS